MKATLYLLPPGSDLFGREHDAPWDQRDGWYFPAATLDVEPCDDVNDTLQAVYARTQHQATDWTRGESVRWTAERELRSSYVGDVIELEGEDSSVFYEIAFADFRRIDLPAHQIPPARSAPPLPSELE